MQGGHRKYHGPRCAWLLDCQGRKGVYDFEEYQDSAVQEKEIVHDSREDGPFAEIALARKRKAVMDQVAEGFHARDKVAVEDAGPEMSLDQLLALASNAQASEEGQGSKVEKEKEKDNASDFSSSSNTGSSEEEAELLAMLGPSKKEQAQAKAKAATSSKEVGDVDVLVLGTTCKDLSRANRLTALLTDRSLF